jgi:hypothetical protein
MTGRVTNSFTQMKIEEEARVQKTAKGKKNKNTAQEEDTQMELSTLEVTEAVLAKLSNPKVFDKIGKKTLANSALVDMTPEDVQELKHNECPQELVKIERDINGGGERKLALDGPRAFENLTAKQQQLD